MIITNLAIQISTLPDYFQIPLILGMLLLYPTGISLTHKGRLFYILPAISTLIGHLFILSAVLEKGYIEEPITRGILSTIPIICVITLAIGAYSFGENNISRRKNSDKKRDR